MINENETNEKLKNIKGLNVIHKTILIDHIKFLTQNTNPLDSKGNEFKILHYIIDDYALLENLFDSLIYNDSFKGDLILESNSFDDNIGYKISKIIGANNLKCIKIGNRNKPFSDRVTKEIGDALENNTNLHTLEAFFDIDKLAPLHICKFLLNPNSALINFTYLKLDKNLFNYMTKYINKSSKINKLGFYFVPLKEVNLFYYTDIGPDIYHAFADQIQNSSNVLQVEVIPLNEINDDLKKINSRLVEDINKITETLNYSCEINQKEFNEKINIDMIFQKEEKSFSNIMYYLFYFLELNSIKLMTKKQEILL